MPIKPTEPSTEQEDLILGLQRGNHKGAISRKQDLDKLVTKDITHGFTLPISMSSAKKIKMVDRLH